MSQVSPFPPPNHEFAPNLLSRRNVASNNRFLVYYSFISPCNIVYLYPEGRNMVSQICLVAKAMWLLKFFEEQPKYLFYSIFLHYQNRTRL